MKQLLRRRLSPALVIACIALFVALGPSAYAVANTVFSTDIVDGEVKTPDIAGSAVVNGKIAANAVTAGKVANDASGADNINATKLDGFEAATFARKSQPAWRVVGTAGQPEFQFSRTDSPSGVDWDHYGNGFASVAFFKDAFGIVHLKGLVKWVLLSDPLATNLPDFATIFQLPSGFRPAERHVFTTTTVEQHARIDVDANGWVLPFNPHDSNGTQTGDWWSLDGITFRAAN